MPELAEDPRFALNAGRMKNRPELVAILSERLKARTSKEWLADLDAAGIPAGPINDIGAMVRDPQVLARDMVLDIDHPRAGRTKALGLPVKLSASPGGNRRPSPLFGQHTREVLAEAGYSSTEIEQLIASGAVALA